jgi:hypothetical protein
MEADGQTHIDNMISLHKKKDVNMNYVRVSNEEKKNVRDEMMCMGQSKRGTRIEWM